MSTSERQYTVTVRNNEGKRVRASVVVTVDWGMLALDVGGQAILNRTRKSSIGAKAVTAKVVGPIEEVQEDEVPR